MAQANRWLILAVVSSALFLIVIDMTVLYTALPRLTHDLAATASEKLWIVNAYPLVVAGLLPGFGALGDRLGHKRMFLAGLAVFGVASLWAAFSPSPGSLIASRVMLAVGAAAMMPATLSLIRLAFTDPGERSFAIGVWAAVASGGAAFGPVVGGVLLEFFWWGSVFLINVPVVVAALVAGFVLLQNRPGRSDHGWDLLGSIQAMVGLVGVTFAIKEFAKLDPSYPLAAATFAVGVVALVVFVRRQRRLPAPLVNFSLFADRTFRAGSIAALAGSGALIGFQLVLSQHLQLVQALSPLEAALFILPTPLAAFVVGPLAGMMLNRVGTERLIWLPLLLAGLAVGAYGLTYQMHPAVWLTALALVGVGVGAAFTAASSAIMVSAPEANAGMAASIEEVGYELGGSVGIALLGSLLSALYSRAMLLPGTAPVPDAARDSLDEALLVAEAMNGADGAALATLARSAFDQSFGSVVAVIAAILIVVAIGLRATLLRRANRMAIAGA